MAVKPFECICRKRFRTRRALEEHKAGKDDKTHAAPTAYVTWNERGKAVIEVPGVPETAVAEEGSEAPSVESATNGST